mgnify:CR=1 FL=1
MISHDLIITTFNSDKYIKNIYNVITKNYQYYTHFFIIDDFSKESFFIILEKEFKNFKKVIIHRINKNSGVSFARNKGLSLSNAIYVSFFDPDDYFHPQKAEITNFFLNKLTPPVLFHDYEIKNKEFKKINRNNINSKIAKIHNKYIFLFKSLYVTPAFTCKRELLEEINGYNENYSYAEDFELYIRLRKITHFYYVNFKLVRICCFHSKEYSKTHLSSNQKQMRINIIKIISSNLKSAKCYEKPFYYFAIAVNYLKKSIFLLRN